MGKLVYSMNVSLDGFVATPDGDPSWGLIDDELHSWWNDQTRSCAASLYGRKIYELMSAYWPTAEENPSSTETEREFARIWKRTPRYVFSTTLERVEHNSRLVRGDVAKVLADIRREVDGDLDVAGPNLAGQFVQRGLVDEYRVVTHPVVLGSGMPFWPTLDARLRLKQIDVRKFASGVEAKTFVKGD